MCWQVIWMCVCEHWILFKLTIHHQPPLYTNFSIVILLLLTSSFALVAITTAARICCLIKEAEIWVVRNCLIVDLYGHIDGLQLPYVRLEFVSSVGPTVKCWHVHPPRTTCDVGSGGSGLWCLASRADRLIQYNRWFGILLFLVLALFLIYGMSRVWSCPGFKGSLQ